MFRLTGRHQGNTLIKPHRSQHHNLYHYASFGSAAPEVLYERTHWCIFRPELLGSVCTNKCGELASLLCGDNVESLCEKGLRNTNQTASNSSNFAVH